MLTLNDGRNELWQWDTGRTLAVDADCSQVHFSNKVFGRSNDVDVIDGIAIIPDILLQTDKDLTAWAFVGTAENGYTKISKTFKVNKRNKPADYVFTPPEQTSLEEIKEKLDYLESIQDPDAIKNAVEDYLDRNPVEAPVQSVNGKTGKIKLTAEDVGAISQDKLQEATNEALAQAKESGAFDGAPGNDGQDGKDYVLTDDDRAEIAEQAAGLVEIPEGYGKAFIVTITESGDKYTADKIPSEIYAAHNSGVPVLASLMAGGGIVTAYLVTATEDAAMFQVPNFMIGEQQTGATVIIAGNEPEDRNVSIVETTIPDSGGNVAYDEAQELTDEQKAQARENIGAQPAGNYLTEVPEGYAKTEDVPTDEEIIQLIKDNAPEPVGGIDLGVTGATVGQTVKISAVDEKGVPTAWEPVDFPSGGGGSGEKWKKFLTMVTQEDLATIELNRDDNGNAFAYDEIHVFAKFLATDQNTAEGEVEVSCYVNNTRQNLHYIMLPSAKRKSGEIVHYIRLEASDMPYGSAAVFMDAGGITCKTGGARTNGKLTAIRFWAQYIGAGTTFVCYGKNRS